MPKLSTAAARRRAPWWLAGDDEECRHCGHGYAREAEMRCAQCDDAACVLCMMHVEGRALCPECAAGERG